MLVEISSDKFRVGAIRFHQGLNVVLGDENATNSIGKSTLLMIVDFAFGGNSLLDYNKDLVPELGHHDYFFSFKFDGEIYCFRRGTNESDLVYKCDEGYEVGEPISVEEYTAFLKASYQIMLEDIGFRELVGLYFRVWGKDNLSVSKPLHVVQARSAEDCVNSLIKTFGRYRAIKSLVDDLEVQSERRLALNKAVRTKLVPRIGKRKFSENEKRISSIEKEVEDIKENLARYATNLSEIVNREVLDLKTQKDRLLAIRLPLSGKLARIKKNISENKYIKSRHFEGLVNFFPNIDRERLVSVEEFHSNIARILGAELRESAKEFEFQIAKIDEEISALDAKMAVVLSSIEQPSIVVDRVYALSDELRTIRGENNIYEVSEDIKSASLSLRERLLGQKLKDLDFIEKYINDAVRRIVSLVYDEGRKSPVIQLGPKNYTYNVYDDTGTGTAYASLVMLDLAIFSMTAVPAIAHDSLLFKNVENDSAAKLFKIYMAHKKQSFIAIDEIKKYGKNMAAQLVKRSVVSLSNQEVLYIKDWRHKKVPPVLLSKEQ